MPFKIIRGDIMKVRADAIVNTANPEVTYGPGVDKAIYEAAGVNELIKARAAVGRLEPGQVAATPAFGLKAKYIIHSSGPVWEGGFYGEQDILASCYEKSLAIAYERGCRSIAFPLMATGAYGFPKRLGMEIAVGCFKKFLEDHDMDITLVVYHSYSEKISGEIFDDVTCVPCDEDVFEDKLLMSYDVGHIPWFSEDEHFDSFAESLDDIEEDLCPFSDLAEIDDELLEDEDIEDADDDDMFPGVKFTGSGINEERSVLSDLIIKKSSRVSLRSLSPKAFLDREKAEEDLEDILKNVYKESFGRYLQMMINKKGLKNNEVYAAANMSKQYFSKLINDKVKPSKEKLFALALGLCLNYDEALDFLGLAGYTFSPIDQTDQVVLYCIKNRIYNVMEADIILFDFGLDSLSS